MARPVWSGVISFGLVSVPVKAYPAVRDHDVHFHQIDKRSGRVVGEIDGFQITLVAGAPRDPAAVLNGIAYIPETGVLLLTGKLWPKVLAVRLAERVP